MGHCCDGINTAVTLITTQCHLGRDKRSFCSKKTSGWNNVWAFMQGSCSRNGPSAQQQSRSEDKNKTTHYLLQTRLVRMLHGAAMQPQKAAVNAGKQRNWGVTCNECHLKVMGFRGGLGGLREQRGADSAKYCSNFGEMRKMSFL